MRIRTLIALGAVAALAVPGIASAGDPVGTAVQQVAGTIAVPNPTRDAPAVVTRHSRTLGLTASAANGTTHWFFKVDPSTIGGEFVLSSTSADADYDVLFYSDPGSINDGATSTDFQTAALGGERGIVPPDTTHVLIYPAAGVNTPFTYTGHAPAEIEIGVDSLDLTVVPGAKVVWVNKTADYAFVTGKNFNSGTGVGRGIPIGGTFATEFSDEGTYAYTTSIGTGTITVAAP